MSNSGGGNEVVRKHFGSFLTAFVVLSLYLMLFQITSLSRSMAFAFNIPIYNVGIYFSKLFGFYDFSTTIGSGIEIIIYEVVKHTKDNGESGNDKTATLVRKGISVVFFVLILITRSVYVLLLYKSNNKAYHFYILSCIEGIFFGFFQIPYYALASQYSASNTLSINASNLLVFLIQSLLEFIMSSNHIKMVRIHSFIVLSLTFISNGLWPYFLFKFGTDFQKGGSQSTSNGSTSASSTCSSSGRQARSLGSASSCRRDRASTYPYQSLILARSDDSYSSDRSLLATSTYLHHSSTRLPNILNISEMTIMSHIIEELKRISSCCNNMSVSISIRNFLSRISQISSRDQIDYELLVTLDLIIVGIRNSLPCENCMLLRQLVLFLRIKTYMNESTQTITEVSALVASDAQVLPLSSTGNQQGNRQKRVRRRRESGSQNGEDCKDHFSKSISRFLMFHMSSLFKDFLFPAILPYALLELNKCRIINILIPIFNITGYMTTFILTEIDGNDDKLGFKKWTGLWDCIWFLLIPIIVVYICSLLAIHSNVRFFKSIVNSQWRVILMVLLLFLSYTFLESVSYSGVANYVFDTCKGQSPLYIIYCHNISCMLFPYLIGKLSVGYNDVRISSGYVLPNFRPVPGFNNKFCYWFWNTITRAFKDIGNDFKFDIKKYL